MSRVDNWRTLLAQFIDERRDRAFEWGSHDCCLFAADWIKTATGYDLADGFRGRYNSALGAHRLTASLGGLVPFVAHCLKEVARPTCASQATAGDLIVRDSGDGDCIGIVLGAQSAFVAKHGLEFLPTGLQADARFWKL
jgi:hypothetical protein